VNQDHPRTTGINTALHCSHTLLLVSLTKAQWGAYRT